MTNLTRRARLIALANSLVARERAEALGSFFAAILLDLRIQYLEAGRPRVCTPPPASAGAPLPTIPRPPSVGRFERLTVRPEGAP